tara:strand:- start:318 stop:941 length:624 start_codon:yes stop_codon:yes gene_type:complete
MSQIKLKHSGGNSVIIAAPDSNPASDRTLKLPGDADGTILTTNSSVGKILQVKQTAKTDTFSTSSQSYVNVTGLGVTITPASSSNKILIILDIKVGASHEDAAYAGRLLRDLGGTNITQIYYGDPSGSRTSASFGTSRQSGNAGYDVLQDRQAVFLDSPNTTGAALYRVEIRGNNGRDTYVNRTHGDSDDDDTPRTASSITVMEIAA